jgi:outer membrane protein assembly factor BamD (BamD/ComL family)
VIKNTIRLVDDFRKKFSEKSAYWNYLNENRAGLVDIYIKKEMEIVDFYIFNNNLLGALNHLKSLDEEFYSEKYRKEIDYRFFELYKYLGYEEGMNKFFNGKKDAK